VLDPQLKSIWHFKYVCVYLSLAISREGLIHLVQTGYIAVLCTSGNTGTNDNFFQDMSQ